MESIELHPEFPSRNGETEYVVIPYAEFPGIPLEEVERRLGISVK